MSSWWSCQAPVAHSCSLLNHLHSFHGRMFKLHTKFDADLLLHLLSHFEYNLHTVHMLIQWRLLPPVTSTVKSSSFTHVCFSPLYLAARLYWCHVNCSCYINKSWNLSRQTFVFDLGRLIACIHSIFCSSLMEADNWVFQQLMEKGWHLWIWRTQSFKNSQENVIDLKLGVKCICLQKDFG